MTINTVLNSKSKGYWDFTNTRGKGIHKICSYPATMVPDMQKELIEIVIDGDKSVKNILDPFHGSGVTLVEGESLGLTPIGFDINPLANLMTRVKLQGINKNKIAYSNKKIRKFLYYSNQDYSIHYFNNINKWFRSDVIKSLSQIRSAIQSETCKNIRQYYWVCLIDIIKKYSNTRSSTFKLHIKIAEDINSMNNKVIDEFLKSIDSNYEFIPDYSRSKKIDLLIGDSKKLLGRVKEESIDLICTSPPYGDNGTTVTYGQFSMLPLYWIDKKDLGVFEETLLENYSSIDSASLGGIRSNLKDSNYKSIVLNNYLKEICEAKQKKVKRFVIDYLEVLEKLAVVLKDGKYLILTLGNRRVDNKVLPLTEITKQFLSIDGFEVVSEIQRNIPNKKMPRKVSKVNNQSVSSMNVEYILILRKGANK
ncbi:site-specific DNA-methyltransferase (cytosine-N4-specific) [Amphibacillus marinus]|uniref:Site-specific DNA-methyltransferase (Cytosine-N4-specific) n=1 Tax=Amphibacillus marinus TaxID=872970 RepID=A0A1H8T8D7_9BACI|nr:modification methylase [Amphibacillus marinus]SEO87320.1 site-specific DNA-methyltransferase (cytosine-N4-specific) [Amphibacillus marinus]